MYRQKKYICGYFLDAEIFIKSDHQKPFTREKKVKESTPAQKNLNGKKAQRYFVRLVHANFCEDDLYLDLTYSDKRIPKTRKEVRRDIKNFISRLKRFRKKHGLPPLKYIYVISNIDENGEQCRLHCHMIINDMDRDAAEQMWGHDRCNSDRLQFDEYGVTGKSLYMTRQAALTKAADLAKGEKTWGSSNGLIKPDPKVSDKFITKTEFDRIERNPEDRQYFEKLYPGWTFSDCTIEEDLINGKRIYIRMRKYGPEKKAKKEKAKKASQPATAD